MSLIEPRPLSQLPSPLPEITAPFHVALVINGVVEQVFHVDERLASALLSPDGQMIQCAHPKDGGPDTGWTYNEGVFLQ